MSETTQEKKDITFLPFHAINEFMRPDFRMKVVRETLNALPELPDRQKNQVNQTVKKAVKIPGFRNPDKAPTMVKVIPTANAFEKQPNLVSAILAAWAETHAALRTQIYDILCERGWPAYPTDIHQDGLETFIPRLDREWRLLPPEVDRTRLPGFYPYWPKDENFEVIYETFSQKFTDAHYSIDETSLMAVWLSLRLPYEIEQTEEPETSPGDADVIAGNPQDAT